MKAPAGEEGEKDVGDGQVEEDGEEEREKEGLVKISL